jgi:hypothetical protein
VRLAVLTPASYISEICRAEQIWALDEGKVVIPVLAGGGALVPIVGSSLVDSEVMGQDGLQAGEKSALRGDLFEARFGPTSE